MELQRALGAVDRSGQMIRGWAVNFSNPDMSCALDLFVGGRHVTTFFPGKVKRPDVKGAYTQLSRDDFGFDLDIREWLLPIAQEVEVRFNSSGDLLTNGRFTCKYVPFDIELIQGLNGYFFYTADSNDVLRQLSRPCGRVQLEVDSVCTQVAAMQAVSRNFSAIYGIMIVPDRTVAVSSEVGNSFELSELRPVLRLVERAKSAYGTDILYPIEEIKSLPLEQRAPRCDTHLSTYATYRCFETLAETYFDTRLKKASQQIHWKEEAYCGDLSNLGQLGITEQILLPTFTSPANELFDTIKLYPSRGFTGSTRVFINSVIADGVVVIFGTSSSRIMLPFFTECFRVVIHVWKNAVDFELIAKIRPTHVFHVVTEKTVGSLSLPDEKTEDGNRLILAASMHSKPADQG